MDKRNSDPKRIAFEIDLAWLSNDLYYLENMKEPGPYQKARLRELQLQYGKLFDQYVKEYIDR